MCAGACLGKAYENEDLANPSCASNEKKNKYTTRPVAGPGLSEAGRQTQVRTLTLALTLTRTLKISRHTYVDLYEY